MPRLRRGDACGLPHHFWQGQLPQHSLAPLPDTWQEVDEVAVKAHFSKWGTVTDVYFPRHKKSLKRRPFCFVSFANSDVRVCMCVCEGVCV